MLNKIGSTWISAMVVVNYKNNIITKYFIFFISSSPLIPLFSLLSFNPSPHHFLPISNHMFLPKKILPFQLSGWVGVGSVG